MNKDRFTFKDSKQHYKTLDGLRGVAAVMVVLFHIFEIFSGGDHAKQIINHGYLAVDFFFVLSGFVIGYAYDDRWKHMSTGEFFKRRLIRLHPMIVVGMLIGAITFYFQDCSYFPAIHGTPLWKFLLVLLIGFTLVPVGSSMDIRGWGEMFPLNGPAWTLFFEYIANILYALVIRRLSSVVLFILVLVAGVALVHLALTNGDVIGGWSLEWSQFRIGLTRLMYPFLAGLLLSRISKTVAIKLGFLWCSLLLMAILAMPRIGDRAWMNGLYDAAVILFLFPFIVYLGASRRDDKNISSRISNFLGAISYPLYIIHYPFIYLFIAWVDRQKPSFEASIVGGVVVLITSIAIAWICANIYDQPVRKWLARKTKSSSV